MVQIRVLPCSLFPWEMEMDRPLAGPQWVALCSELYVGLLRTAGSDTLQVPDDVTDTWWWRSLAVTDLCDVGDYKWTTHGAYDPHHRRAHARPPDATWLVTQIITVVSRVENGSSIRSLQLVCANGDLVAATSANSSGNILPFSCFFFCSRNLKEMQQH